MNSKAAYDLPLADKNILFINMRDPVEVGVFGRPGFGDAMVPIKIQIDRFDADLGDFVLAENPEFLDPMKGARERTGNSRHDMTIATSGSGWRPAIAVRRLVVAGDANVWLIPDGDEGEGEDKPGMNSDNAWRAAGPRWSKRLAPGSEWRRWISTEDLSTAAPWHASILRDSREGPRRKPPPAASMVAVIAPSC